MNIADLHTHTFLCRHAVGTPEEYLKAAVENGLRIYGISDHCPGPEGYDSQFRMSRQEYPEYRRIQERIRAQGASMNVTVLSGMEIDWVPGRMQELRAVLNPTDFDYLLGSIHYVGDFAYDDPDKLAVWREPGMPEKIWKRYPVLLRDFVESGGFDILAHADLPKKFGYRPEFTPEFIRIWHEIFEIAAQKNIAVELNTNGLTREVKEIYPSLTLLKIAREHGIRLTYGSDSHKPESLGAFFAEAVQLAETAGFKCFHYFRKHEIMELPFR